MKILANHPEILVKEALASFFRVKERYFEESKSFYESENHKHWTETFSSMSIFDLKYLNIDIEMESIIIWDVKEAKYHR